MAFQIISISLFYHCIGMIDMMVEEVGVMKEVIMIDMKGRMICTTQEEDIRIVEVEEVIKHYLPKYYTINIILTLLNVTQLLKIFCILGV